MRCVCNMMVNWIATIFTWLFLNDLSNFMKISEKHPGKQCKLKLWALSTALHQSTLLHIWGKDEGLCLKAYSPIQFPYCFLIACWENRREGFQRKWAPIVIEVSPFSDITTLSLLETAAAFPQHSLLVFYCFYLTYIPYNAPPPFSKTWCEIITDTQKITKIVQTGSVYPSPSSLWWHHPTTRWCSIQPRKLTQARCPRALPRPLITWVITAASRPVPTSISHVLPVWPSCTHVSNSGPPLPYSLPR